MMTETQDIYPMQEEGYQRTLSYSIIESVVGSSFLPQLTPDSYKQGIHFLERDTLGVVVPGLLIPEPTNPYDPNAVKVLAATSDRTYHHVGYLSKKGHLYSTITKPTEIELKIVFYSRHLLNDSFRIVKRHS